MNKKRFAALIALVLLVLGGCRLAKEDGAADLAGDRLVGVFVTREYLDLFDFEGYFNDNIMSFTGGGEIVIDEASDKYSGRIYAARVSVPLTSEETGEVIQHEEYVFQDLDGMAFFIAEVVQGESTYTTTASDEAIDEAQIAIGAQSTLEGTIYVTPGRVGTFYINPVYQSGDGSVYVISGSGISGDMGEGSVFSQSIDQTDTVTVGGEEMTESFSVKINIAVASPPERVAVIQMDAESRMLGREELSPDVLPDELTVIPGAAYIILETHSPSLESGMVVSREIIQSGQADFKVRRARDDGVCAAKLVRLLWDWE